jgi:hypothetical protein
MSSAFKCDSCGDYYDGEPNRRKYREYRSEGLTGWADSHTITGAELCDGCAKYADDAVAQAFGDEDET